jgi:predicted nucleic acid-binding protein
MRALLDVNVLIALLDSDHLHHTRAMAWLQENIQSGWASCPLTENGCIRIMSQPGYPQPTAGRGHSRTHRFIGLWATEAAANASAIAEPVVSQARNWSLARCFPRRQPTHRCSTSLRSVCGDGAARHQPRTMKRVTRFT